VQIKQKADVNPRCVKKVTFLRQHDLDQVPGVETKNSFLSADVYRLPQSTNAAYCTSKAKDITYPNVLSMIRMQHISPHQFSLEY